MTSDRRLHEMGIDPDGDPGEIMREVTRRYHAIRSKYEEADTPIVVDGNDEPCQGTDAAAAGRPG